MIIPLIIEFSREWSQGIGLHTSISADLSTEVVPIIVDDEDVRTAFSPGSSSVARINTTTATFSDFQRHVVIRVDNIDFVTMHNLLYFLYTGRVNLHFGEVEARSLTGYPDKADAFDLYRAADFYCLQTLADRCFRFLMHTRTPDNICERLFNINCKPYKELQKEYINFLLEHYEEVKITEDWKSSFFNRIEELTMEEQRYRSELLLDITSRLVFTRSV